MSETTPLSLSFLARLCAATYADVPTLRAAYPTGELVEVDDLRAVLLRGENPIVAVRGTVPADWRNWLLDGDCGSVATTYGRVHRGFLRGADAMWRELHTSSVLLHGGRVTFTGHSLGGAVAALLALWHGESDLVTFGQPRVGDATCARALDELPTYTRVCNYRDPVTDVPSLGGFRHGGSVVWFDGSGVVAPYPAGEPAAEVLRVARDVMTGDVPDLVRDLGDHLVGGYVERCEAAGV